jgi:hypothetical protein
LLSSLLPWEEQSVRRVLDPPLLPSAHQDLLGVRTDTPYTPAERQYSVAVQRRLEEQLAGKRQQLFLLRRYHQSPGTIATMPAPPGVNRAGLRTKTVERMLVATLSFIRDVSPGGCVVQCSRDGQLIETQQFSTKYPHILIERVDVFEEPSRAPFSTEWRLRRIQNQRAETQINRWLDAAGLAFNVAKLF